MSMTSEEIKKEFDQLSTFETADDEYQLEARVLISQFISEINIRMEHLPLSRKELAKQIGTSASFITQVFRGDKLMNFLQLAKIQKALGMKFKIKQEISYENSIINNEWLLHCTPAKEISPVRVDQDRNYEFEEKPLMYISKTAA